MNEELIKAVVKSILSNFCRSDIPLLHELLKIPEGIFILTEASEDPD